MFAMVVLCCCCFTSTRVLFAGEIIFPFVMPSQRPDPKRLVRQDLNTDLQFSHRRQLLLRCRRCSPLSSQTHSTLSCTLFLINLRRRDGRSHSAAGPHPKSRCPHYESAERCSADVPSLPCFCAHLPALHNLMLQGVWQR